MAISIGVSGWVWASPVNNESLSLVRKTKEMEFDVFEIPFEFPNQFDYDKMDAALKETGMRAALCGAFGPDRDLTNEDPKLRQNSLDYIRAALPLCQRWGSKVFIGPMYSAVGKRRFVTPDQKKREWDLAVTGLQQAAKMAGDHGVTLCVEPLNRFETDLVNTVEQAVRMVNEIGSKSVGLLVDTFHMHIEEKDVYQAIKLGGALVKHVHTCENDRGAPGSGQVHWDKVAKGLKEIGYDGICSIESFTPANKIIAGAAAIWRPLARSQDDLARDGLKFLRGLLK